MFQMLHHSIHKIQWQATMIIVLSETTARSSSCFWQEEVALFQQNTLKFINLKTIYFTGEIWAEFVSGQQSRETSMMKLASPSPSGSLMWSMPTNLSGAQAFSSWTSLPPSLFSSSVDGSQGQEHRLEGEAQGGWRRRRGRVWWSAAAPSPPSSRSPPGQFRQSYMWLKEEEKFDIFTWNMVCSSWLLDILFETVNLWRETLPKKVPISELNWKN